MSVSFCRLKRPSYTSVSCISKQERMKNSLFLCTEGIELGLGYEKKESINTFPVILVLYELLNGKYSFRKVGLWVSFYCRPLWRVKLGNISLGSSAREVFKVASFNSAEMKEDRWRNDNFLWKNRKYTWSDVQRLAVTQLKYYLIRENVHELSFLKSFRCLGLFKKFYQILGQRWNWGRHVIEVDPATYISKGHLLLSVPFHLHARMFKQPGLLSAVLSHIPGFTGH